jgi:Spy/CpxP family protein refolding chaperone
LEKELELTSSQRDRFFLLYDQMSERTMKMFEEVRAKETALQKKGDSATDADYLALAKAMSNVKSREGAIEMEYFNKFKQVLSARQMVKLKKAEHKFSQNMMRQHEKTRQSARTPKR